MSFCDRCNGWYCSLAKTSCRWSFLVCPAGGTAAATGFMTTSRGQSRLRARIARCCVTRACWLTQRSDARASLNRLQRWPSQGEVVALADDLLDEVTGLVEWPTALRGSFDPDFLEVPAQALISAMKTHQKYFHLNDADSGALLPAFITVSNIESRDPDAVVTGNERVIRPRLSDAAFFFANDKQSPLVSRQERLASVVFQHHLGSLLDKTQRISAVATELASAIGADMQRSLNAQRNSVNATWCRRWCWNFRSYRELRAHTMRSTTAKWLPLPKPSKSTTTLALRGIACPPPLRRPRSRSRIASIRWWVFSVSGSRPRGQRIRLPCVALHLRLSECSLPSSGHYR